jgi:hypothetical protein
MMVFRRSLVGKLLCVLLVAAAGVGCTKKEVLVSKEAMFGMAPKEGPDKVNIVLARDINDAIPCSDYGEGCLSAHRLKTRDLDFIAIEFSSRESARAASRKVRGWTYENWLFDDVEGEPELVRWLQRYFTAHRYAPEKAADSPQTLPGTAPASPPISP